MIETDDTITFWVYGHNYDELCRAAEAGLQDVIGDDWPLRCVYQLSIDTEIADAAVDLSPTIPTRWNALVSAEIRRTIPRRS